MRRVILLPAVLLLATCSDSVLQTMPDFELQDVNPTSPTYLTPVSPRDYLTMVSGFYFGHAT